MSAFSIKNQISKILAIIKNDAVALNQLERVFVLSEALVSLLHKNSTTAMLSRPDHGIPSVEKEAAQILQDLSDILTKLNASLKNHRIAFGPTTFSKSALQNWSISLVFNYLRNRR